MPSELNAVNVHTGIKTANYQEITFSFTILIRWWNIWKTQPHSAELHPQAESLLRFKLEIWSGTCMWSEWKRLHPSPYLYLALSFPMWHTHTYTHTHTHTHTQGAQHTMQLFTTDTYLPGSSRMAFVRLPSCGSWQPAWWQRGDKWTVS